MNHLKWSRPEIPISLLALKLCEEAAEVGTEISDMQMSGEVMSQPFTREADLLVELDHVEFFVDLIRSRIQGDQA